MKKSVIQETISELPEEFDLQKLIYKLVVIDKIEQGLKDGDEGKTLTVNQVKKHFAEKWSK